ncbi:MAG: glycine cleavage system aminomethyltransferase GcvT, partial [Cyanobacteria bacterium P01_A01_bin.135]
GWEMPVQFEGIRAEHEAVRNGAGLFDISHMAMLQLQGPALMDQLQGLVPTDLSALEPGNAQYTVLLNEQAGIIDDLIIYRQADQRDQRSLIIANAATTDKDIAWLQHHLSEGQLTHLTDRALLALQGPEAEALLQTLTSSPLSQLGRFQHGELTLQGHPALVARTGYTGEDGFEIMVPAAAAADLWRSLLEAGALPCGLGARDTLRLEAAMALYGQDIDDNTTPLEAGMGWLVHLDRKGEFVGRSALEQTEARRKLVGLQMQGRAIARHGYPIHSSGDPVGEVTSGTLSPTLGYPISLAYVEPAFAKVGQPLEVIIRGKAHPAQVVKRPFYRRR